MHYNFYHWHAKTEVASDVPALQKRWDAAAKFASKLSADDILKLLRMALFPNSDPAFNARFGEELVKADPTFSTENNEHLLRVMAAATLSSKMESFSQSANCVALGLRAANFPDGRIAPICRDLLSHGAQYLAKAAEYYRPQFKLEALVAAEKKVETSIASLKEASAAGDPAKLSVSIEAFSKLMVASLKESHGHIGKVIGRVTEENQVCWWMIGKRSTELNSRRHALTPLSYVIASARELADRVTVPPPASAADLLDEVLSHCEGKGKEDGTLIEMASATEKVVIDKTPAAPVANDIMPISFALWEVKSHSKVTGVTLKEIGINSKDKFSAGAFATQYFYELMFERALKTV